MTHAVQTGSFTKKADKMEIVPLGEIPAGVRDLNITLTAQQDLDIQLHDMERSDLLNKSKPYPIVSWCNIKKDKTCTDNIGNVEFGPVTGDYLGVNYTYSGYAGTDLDTYGSEYIKIKGVTNRRLMMKILGYQPGECDVNYEYFHVPTTAALKAMGYSLGESATCVDYRLQNGNPWHDSVGDIFSCQWYASEDGNLCDKFGTDPSNANEGLTARNACCACGGGRSP
jgi:hypothetical protein